MMMRLLVTMAGAVVLAVGCGDNDNGHGGGSGTPAPTPTATPTQVTAAAVVATYADVLYATYQDALAGAEALEDAIDALVEAPTQATFDAAKAAWIAARPAYQQSEIGRFYNGPIDDPATGPEGRINAWPLDENYIDYVEGAPTSGIVNDPAGFPVIDEETLTAANEAGGETNIASGYHAIEFLLWGQDRSATGPGARPFTDYVTDGSGTAENQERRGAYLQAASHLLVDDLRQVVDAWTPGDAGNYRAEFLALDPDEALGRILTGLGTLSASELGGERLSVAYETRDQEDEHSCFSDTTHDDHVNDALGIQNGYLGRYRDLDGPGLDDLVRQVDPALDARVQQEIAASIAAVRAIPEPFDQAILGADDSPGRVAVEAAIAALFTQADGLADVADVLGVSAGVGE
ncbi:MAG: iron-regulated protein [Deltaproteobacteria bacterium]|nr:iron-regulated protein [Deltaproteobacteria bacterium]